MRTTRIIIKNLYGITECELDGRSVEITGTNGTGKTSVIDAIRLALTNSSGRDYIIRKGETEGEILIETDTGLRIDRKKRSQQADYKSIKENGREVSAPEAFLLLDRYTYLISGTDLWCPDAEYRSVWLEYCPQPAQIFFTHHNRDPKLYPDGHDVERNSIYNLYQLIGDNILNVSD